MTHPRGLSEDEAQAWEKLAASVVPLVSTRTTGKAKPPSEVTPSLAIRAPARTGKPPARPTVVAHSNSPAPPRPGNLDGHWDRKLKNGDVAPDLTLDLHGHGLDAAYGRLMGGMAQARGMGARIVLVIAGKPRPVDPADRGVRRGAIRAKILDWLAASEHGAAIAAIRKAHRRHGGEGALYVVLRRG